MELLVIIIVLALIFDYINGFHDAANSIATIVSTKVLTPFQAVIWAAFFNFVAFFIAKCVIGGFGIANTVSKTVMEPYITLPIILAGVIAAIAWNLFTWWKGIPSSSSHTLIGGFAGAAIMAHGFEAIQLSIILKIAAFIFLAPLIGMVVAFGFTLLVLYICRRAHPHTAELWFKKLQLVSSALFSIGHGLNDSQKVMGIIAAAMIAGHSEGLGMGINSIDDLPDWVAFSCFTAISLGTMSGGWNHGNQNYEGDAAGRGGCGNCRCVYTLSDGVSEDSGEYDTHHYGSHYRGRGHEAAFGRTLGSYEESDDRLGADYPRQCFAGSRDLLYRISFLEVLPHKK